jgi:hypothetical protein
MKREWMGVDEMRKMGKMGKGIVIFLVRPSRSRP